MTLVMTGLAMQSESSVLVNKEHLSLSVRMPFSMYISQEVNLPYYFILFTSKTCENCTEIHNGMAEGLVVL
jgi:hypothetical protein